VGVAAASALAFRLTFALALAFWLAFRFAGAFALDCLPASASAVAAASSGR
jgi:hypothetical protein